MSTLLYPSIHLCVYFFSIDPEDKSIDVDKELVDTLISHIEISKYKQVTIYFKFNLDKDMEKQLEVENE